MKKIKRYISCGILSVLIFSSCAGFLDVNPKGEIFDGDMFTTAEGYEDALYGIYAELGTKQYLYSDYMYWLPEVLSINVTSNNSGFQYLAANNRDASIARQITSPIWETSYKVINHINNILKHIEDGGDDQFPYSKLYKGEALALRAMLHFDLLRIYGAPVWADKSDKAKAIPYVTKYSFSITKFSSWDEAYAQIITDLKLAEEYLEADANLLEANRDNASAGGFTSCRIIHMNQYAVQALLARAYWYKNDFKNAAIYAKKVIDSKKFDFRPKEKFIQADNGTLDLNETIFGLYSEVSNEKNGKAYGITSTSESFTLNPDWISLYEDGSSSTGSDYRFSAWFDGVNYKNLVNNIFLNASDDKNKYSGQSILGVSLLRITEMYYIMADALLESDPAEATKYFDAVTTSRGLDAIGEGGLTVTEDVLYRERRKEFYGEGQQWFNMKRLGKDVQVTSTLLLPGKSVSTYTIKYPLDEDQNRE